MSKRSLMPEYRDGERHCPLCGVPLPAHQTWPGAKYRICGKPECVTETRRLKKRRYIGPNENKCEAGDCAVFLPAGLYAVKGRLCCSAECWYRRDSQGSHLIKCSCGCGTEFLRRSIRRRKSGLYFFSVKHSSDYVREQHLAESCGPFRGLMDEYLDGSAVMRYRDVKNVRNALARLFLFLNVLRIDALEDVTPKTITQFLKWAKDSGHCVSASDVSRVSMFFRWMIAEDRRTAANPVISLIHSPRKKHRLPRPFEEEELDLAWQLLHQRGTARLRFTAAAAEESGLRGGEICRLHVEDVDIEQQRFFVRLPNKTNCERWAFFGDKTKRYYIEWMAERRADCGHDFVLHNSLGNPLKIAALITEFNRVLCKTFMGKTIQKIGFDQWSTHRFRHTMASRLVSAGADAATVMAAGGWKSYEAMSGYVRVDEELARRGYDQAMEYSLEQKQLSTRKKLLTPAALLERRQQSVDVRLPSEMAKRCV